MNDDRPVRINIQIQMKRTYTSQVQAKNKKTPEAVASEVGLLCDGDDLSPSVFEDDYFAIHCLFGIQALDVRRVQWIHLHLHRAHQHHKTAGVVGPYLSFLHKRSTQDYVEMVFFREIHGM